MVTGIYIHIPFCSRSCAYCHFVTVPYDEGKIEKYGASLVKEIALYAQSLGKEVEVDSIYFGGGTPSLLDPRDIEEILNACRDHFAVTEDCEISLEANPDTLRCDKTTAYRNSGVNRISLGVQSFHDRELEALGRAHRMDSIAESVETLKTAGFTNINLDLLLGIPLQTAESWRAGLERIPNAGFTHVSVYMLDLDEPCALSAAISEGSLAVAEDDAVAGLYLDTIGILESYGYLQYEISNFAKPGCACRHNLKYWTREPVVGFGLASHSFDGHSRHGNFRGMERYLQALRASCLPVQWRKTLEEEEILGEKLFLGLRLNKGVRWTDLERAHSRDRLREYENFLRELGDEGFVVWEGSDVRLTPEGMLLSNEIFQQFV